MAENINELLQEFYATQLGLSEPWPSLIDLQYAFLLGVKTGDIVLGGVSSEDLDAAIVAYNVAHPPTPNDLPVIFADSPTTFESKAVVLALKYPGYSGRVRYDSIRYLDHPAPADYSNWDVWRRWRSA